MKYRLITLLLFVLAIPAIAAEDDIFQAAKDGNLNSLKLMLAENPDLINAVSERGSTPFHIAVYYGHRDLAEYLISQKADVEAENPSGYTPLFYAAMKNHTGLVDLLIKANADVNHLSAYGTSAMHDAAYNGNLDILRLLLENGADPNIDSPILATPLHRAAFAGNHEAAEYLLDHGADIGGHDGTVLIEPALTGKVEATRLLIERGAPLNKAGRTGMTPLHSAISAGHNYTTDIALMLIEAGAEINTRTESGETPLMTAVGKGYPAVVTGLLENGADSGVIESGAGRNLLHLAAINGYAEIVKILIDESLPLDEMDEKNKLPIYYAGKYGHQKAAELLLESGAKKIIGEQNFGPSKYLKKKLKKNEAYIWYMNNRGWTIKTRKHLLVFDNEEKGNKPDRPLLANGYISAREVAKQNIIALYTAFHGEPETIEFIHAIEDSVKKISYLQYKDDRWRGCKNSFYLKGREELEIGGAKIYTVEMHLQYGMGSLGYLVEVDGLKLFYSCFLPEDFEIFKEEIDYLAEKHDYCDLAFLQIEDGEEIKYMEYFAKKLNPKVVFPIDPSRRIEKYSDMKHKLAQISPDIGFGLPDIPGDRFHYKSGSLIE